jgi:hypothetical protein
MRIVDGASHNIAQNRSRQVARGNLAGEVRFKVPGERLDVFIEARSLDSGYLFAANQHPCSVTIS